MHNRHPDYDQLIISRIGDKWRTVPLTQLMHVAQCGYGRLKAIYIQQGWTPAKGISGTNAKLTGKNIRVLKEPDDIGIMIYPDDPKNFEQTVIQNKEQPDPLRNYKTQNKSKNEHRNNNTKHNANRII